MNPASTPNPAGPHPSTTVDLEAIARRTLAIGQGDPSTVTMPATPMPEDLARTVPSGGPDGRGAPEERA